VYTYVVIANVVVVALLLGLIDIAHPEAIRDLARDIGRWGPRDCKDWAVCFHFGHGIGGWVFIWEVVVVSTSAGA
jgi:hypothetical protein